MITHIYSESLKDNIHKMEKRPRYILDKVKIVLFLLVKISKKNNVYFLNKRNFVQNLSLFISALLNCTIFINKGLIKN